MKKKKLRLFHPSFHLDRLLHVADAAVGVVLSDAHRTAHESIATDSGSDWSITCGYGALMLRTCERLNTSPAVSLANELVDSVANARGWHVQENGGTYVAAVGWW